MNAKEAVEMMIGSFSFYVIRVDSEQEYLKLARVLKDNGYYYCTYDAIVKEYGDRFVICLDDRNEIFYQTYDERIEDNYTVLVLNNSHLISVIMKSLGFKEGDKFNIVDKNTGIKSRFSPYMYINGVVVDRDGDICSSATTMGKVLFGRAYCKAVSFPQQGDKAYYIDIDKNVLSIVYDKKNTTCRILKCMGNVFKTEKDAKDNMDNIIEKYNS